MHMCRRPGGIGPGSAAVPAAFARLRRWITRLPEPEVSMSDALAYRERFSLSVLGKGKLMV